nr:hypothetical protein CFP56_67323 [Quercus suber]
MRNSAGNVLSFRPDAGTECFVMQGRCNAATAYADLYHDSADVGDLSDYAWIAQAQSYICFEAVEGTAVKSRVLEKVLGIRS